MKLERVAIQASGFRHLCEFSLGPKGYRRPVILVETRGMTRMTRVVRWPTGGRIVARRVPWRSYSTGNGSAVAGSRSIGAPAAPVSIRPTGSTAEESLLFGEGASPMRVVGTTPPILGDETSALRISSPLLRLGVRLRRWRGPCAGLSSSRRKDNTGDKGSVGHFSPALRGRGAGVPGLGRRQVRL